uniref:ion channel TACAN-like isoform X4 n=1 Tax=Doryrhamphus excisus TaxID=161450 RepID=UPI0025AE7B3B|nr:ion channel TACAN-like isoform X4 [Doryrhamphus excisus]
MKLRQCGSFRPYFRLHFRPLMTSVFIKGQLDAIHVQQSPASYLGDELVVVGQVGPAVDAAVGPMAAWQETHRLYLQKLDEISKLQNSCSRAISHHRERLKEISSLVKKCSKGLSEEDAKSLDQIKEKIKIRPNTLSEMEAFLPKKNGLYLSLVLGNVNITLLSKQSKFAYKDEYEKFKLYLTVVLLLFSFVCYFFVSYRFLDAILNFLLVWYYCTLTIRESILISNGSRIKGWWVFHHYISAFLSGVMLTWPDGNLYKVFRNQFLAYSLYQSFVQCLQCYYQSGCLYRLRALGERHNMDLTVVLAALQ